MERYHLVAQKRVCMISPEREREQLSVSVVPEDGALEKYEAQSCIPPKRMKLMFLLSQLYILFDINSPMNMIKYE